MTTPIPSKFEWTEEQLDSVRPGMYVDVYWLNRRLERLRLTGGVMNDSGFFGPPKDRWFFGIVGSEQGAPLSICDPESLSWCTQPELDPPPKTRFQIIEEL